MATPIPATARTPAPRRRFRSEAIRQCYEARRFVLPGGDDWGLHRIHYHFGVVLGLILTSLAFQLAAGESDWARLITVILQAITLMAAVIASRVHPWVIRLTAVASVLAVLGAAMAILGSDEFGDNSGRLVTLLLVALVPPALVYGLLNHMRQQGGVTVQTMFAVLCLYLLAGLLFGITFAAIEEVGKHPFFKELNAAKATTSDFLYFSYTTITTVGYGNLLPRTNLGRSLAITEALLGQIYLVTVVAVIVGNIRGPRRARGATRN